MTAYEIRKIQDAIADCTRYIDREEKRNASLRPAEIAKRLEWYKAHRAKLENMLKGA